MKTIVTPVEIKGTSFWNNKKHYQAILKPREERGWEFTITKNNRRVKIPVKMGSLARPLTPIGKRQLVITPNGNPLSGDRIKIAEHLLSLKFGLGIDALNIELPDGNLPYFFSAYPFIEVLPDIIEIEGDSALYVGKKTEISSGLTYLSYEPQPNDHLVVKVTVEYPSPVGIQSLSWSGDSESFKEFSKGRSFTWRPTHLLARDLARKINFPLAIFSDQYSLTAENYQEKKWLIDSQGRLIDIAAHRLIDFLGMLSFIPGRLFGTIKNIRSSHMFDRLFVEKLLNDGLRRLN